MKFRLKEFIFEDEGGRKIKLSFDGSFSPEDISKIIGKFQGEGPVSEDMPHLDNQLSIKSHPDYDSLTIREKLELIVKQIKHGWFTSEHIRELYHYNFHEEVKPSTVSTYLARMFAEDILERRGSRARREYRLAEKQITAVDFISQV